MNTGDAGSDAKRVLLIEDDAVLGKILKAVLESEGMQVHHCIDSGNALAVFPTSGFSALIADYRLPGMSGADVVRTLRATSPGTLMIGMSIEERREKDFLEAGADVFFPKPFDINKLLSLLAQCPR